MTRAVIAEGFLTLVVSLLFLVPQTATTQVPVSSTDTPVTCPVSESTPDDAALPPLGQLTPSAKPIVVEIHFVATFNGTATQLPSPVEQTSICSAAMYFSKVWSSTEFQDKLQHAPDFILGASGFLGLGHKTITGSELLGELTSKPTITLEISTSDIDSVVENCALSPGNGQQTVLRRNYLDKDPAFRCGSPLISALVNTLSHEYTHYPRSVGSAGSTDGGIGAKNNLRYVSYGIGCITQQLAFPSSECSDRTRR